MPIAGADGVRTTAASTLVLLVGDHCTHQPARSARLTQGFVGFHEGKRPGAVAVLRRPAVARLVQLSNGSPLHGTPSPHHAGQHQPSWTPVSAFLVSPSR